MGYRKGYFKKDGTYVQAHFTNTRSKSYSKKNKGCMLILLMSMTFGLAASCSESSESNCPTKTCGDFATQAQAQAAYDSDRNCYKNLDRDGNGKACESLK